MPGQYTAADLAAPVTEMWPSHQQAGQYTAADLAEEAPPSTSTSFLSRLLPKTPPGQDISADRAVSEFRDYMNRGANSMMLGLGLSGLAAKPELPQTPEFKMSPADLDVYNPAAGVRAEANIPRTDVIAENPAQRNLQMAAGVRGRGPLTVLPSENRGLALPPGPRAEMPVSAEPLPPMPTGPSTVPLTLSGESALGQVLTGLDNKTLLKVARSRGIDVSREAQLKPGVADDRIIKKIIDDFSPEKLQDVCATYLETTRMTPQPWARSTPENWHVRVLQQYFPEVQIPAASLKRFQQSQAARTVSLADLLGTMR